MWCVRWTGVLRWLADAKGTETLSMEQLQHEVTVHDNASIANVEILMSSDSFTHLGEDLALFQSTIGRNATFWSEFKAMVQVLLRFIRAPCTQNW